MSGASILLVFLSSVVITFLIGRLLGRMSPTAFQLFGIALMLVPFFEWYVYKFHSPGRYFSDGSMGGMGRWIIDVAIGTVCFIGGLGMVIGARSRKRPEFPSDL